MSRNRIAVAVALGALAAGGYAAHHEFIASADAHPRVVLEDDPSWDCRTMGNGICGPGAVLPDGSPVVAGQYRDGVLVPWSQSWTPEWCADVCRGS